MEYVLSSCGYPKQTTIYWDKHIRFKGYKVLKDIKFIFEDF